ncbi:PAS domain S-box protein [Flavobacterium sp. Sd200]|uniref:PAS domain S-box protein n=1 Tax=Flavobacterium sp. Sd200 TaxID=2692211 RepID=UPI001367F510|nr:PAS domain S-box protein [Flavobacterium sp. Sd200]MXN91333.1 PAS domain S-box protein [Flavobacterium sp. Sd200]
MQTFSDGFSILQALPAAVYTCNKDGIIIWYNEEAQKLWGKPLQVGYDKWYVGLTVFNSEGLPLDYENTPVARALTEEKDINQSEIIIEDAYGSLKQFAVNIKLTHNGDGTVSGAIVVLTDSIFRTQSEADKADDRAYRSLSELLERKVDERTQSLKKSEERYHKMIEEVQDYAIVLLDTEGFIINWNRGAEKIKGYTEKEILGRNFREFYLDHDRVGLLPEKLIKQAHDTGRAMHEGWRRRKDGTAFWGSIVITALHDADNNIIGFSKVTRDLTERKLADDQMANYAKDIEFRNKQLEEYAYIASHDLQEPLRKIQIFSEMLENDLEENQKEGAMRSLEKIKTASRRMSNLIKDVLKYSQLSRADELFETVDLNTIFATVKEDFDLLTEQKGVTIQHTALPVITGIPIQLHQLFGNLLSNAIKFSSEDPLIEIETFKVPQTELEYYPKLNPGRSYVKIIFKDNGIGFNQQYGEQIFKMFKRLTDNSGTGIGLALCKKIVQNHNGHISVASEIGKGTQFTILLPVG